MEIPAIAPTDIVEPVDLFCEGVSLAAPVAAGIRLEEVAIVARVEADVVDTTLGAVVEELELVLVERAANPPSVETMPPSAFSTMPSLSAQQFGSLSQQ
jgi:hypothetical protein